MSDKYGFHSDGYKLHIKNLVNWLLREIEESGGDGDATWVVRTLNLQQVRDFIIDECLTDDDKKYWTISGIVQDKNGSFFSLANGQECLIIVDSEKCAPPWSQCTVIL